MDLEDEARFLYDLMNFSELFCGASMRVLTRNLFAGPGERLTVALEEAKRHGVMGAEVSVDYVHRLVEASRANVQALMSYRPAPLNHPIWFFRPTLASVLEEASGQDLGADLGWDEIPGLTLVAEKVPGDHFTMMTGENARRLAERLIARLEGEAEPSSREQR